MRCAFGLCIIVLFLVVTIAGAIALAGTKSDKSPTSKPAAESPSWHKVKSSSGNARTNASVTSKFQVGSANWRLKLSTSAVSNVPASSATARVALMMATTLDTEGKPVNWQQVDLLLQGKAGQSVEREFDNGLDRKGEPNWFALSVLGYGATYEVTIEDQAPAKKKASKKNE